MSIVADLGMIICIGGYIVRRRTNFTGADVAPDGAGPSFYGRALGRAFPYAQADDLPLAGDPYTAIDTAIPDRVWLPLKRQRTWSPIKTDVQEELYNRYPSASIARGASQCAHVAPFHTFVIVLAAVSAPQDLSGEGASGVRALDR
jgi:hypothetical protein